MWVRDLKKLSCQLLGSMVYRVLRQSAYFHRLYSTSRLISELLTLYEVYGWMDGWRPSALLEKQLKVFTATTYLDLPQKQPFV